MSQPDRPDKARALRRAAGPLDLVWSCRSHRYFKHKRELSPEFSRVHIRLRARFVLALRTKVIVARAA